MSESRKSWLAAAGIVVGVFTVYMGSLRRDQVDLGTLQAAQSGSLSGLRADRSTTVDIPIAAYFTMLSEKLKEAYVEPVTDDQKLASGAVRGMVSSLGDPRSLYMDAAEYAVYLGQQKGHFEGIGAYLDLEMAAPLNTRVIADVAKPSPSAQAANSMIPKLTVRAVVPGGPADRAGVKIGDVVDSVDGLWVVNSDELDRFRKLTRLVAEKKAAETELMALRKVLQPKLEKSILPLKARDKITIGTSGALGIVWRRGSSLLPTSINRAKSEMPGPKLEAGRLRMPLNPAGLDALKPLLTPGAKLTLDLRNNPDAAQSMLLPALELLAPKGTLAEIRGRGPVSTRPVKVTNGSQVKLDLTILADSSTGGSAAHLATILKARGLAKVVGNMPSHPYVEEHYSLPDGSGYSLVTGKLSPLPIAKGGKA